MHTLGTADRLFFDEMAYIIVRDAAPSEMVQALVDVIWAFQAMDPPGGGGALGPAVLLVAGFLAARGGPVADRVQAGVDYAAPPVTQVTHRAEVSGEHVHVDLPAGNEIVLDLAMDRQVNEPSYASLY